MGAGVSFKQLQQSTASRDQRRDGCADAVWRRFLVSRACPRPVHLLRPISVGGKPEHLPTSKAKGVAPPEPQTLEEANLSAMARSFYVSRRRVGSRVIKPELGLDLLYPDYESGLAAILAAEDG